MPRHPDRQIERLAQPEAARLLATSGVAVVATGSVEQHGGHLPLGTDAFAALSDRRAGRRPAGHRGRARSARWAWRTTTCPGRARCRCRRPRWPRCWSTSAAAWPPPGARRILVVNWHEGNSATLRLAADQAQQRARGAGGDRRDARDHAHHVSRTRWSSPTPGRWRRRRCWPTSPAWCTWTRATRASERAAGRGRARAVPAARRVPGAARLPPGRPDRLVRPPGTGRRRPGRSRSPRQWPTMSCTGPARSGPRWGRTEARCGRRCSASSASWPCRTCRCPCPARVRCWSGSAPAASAAPT